METLQSTSFDKICRLYEKFFSLNYIGSDISDKFALISLTCYLTKELQKKGKKVNCYDILLTIGKDFSDFEKNTFLKSLGAICENFMYGCDKFPTFDLKPKDMPKTIRNILNNYCPF